MALQKDIEKIEKLLEEKETISVISAVGENGNPISQVGRKLTMWGKGGKWAGADPGHDTGKLSSDHYCG